MQSADMVFTHPAAHFVTLICLQWNGARDLVGIKSVTTHVLSDVCLQVRYRARLHSPLTDVKYKVTNYYLNIL